MEIKHRQKCNFMIFNNHLTFVTLNLAFWQCSIWVWVTFHLYYLTFSEFLDCTWILLIKSGVLLYHCSLNFCFSSLVVSSVSEVLFIFSIFFNYPFRLNNLYWLIFKFEYTFSCQQYILLKTSSEFFITIIMLYRSINPMVSFTSF